MEIIKTHIVNWREKSMGTFYDSLCKVHVVTDENGDYYIREYDTGKMTKMVVITFSEFQNQKDNPLF